MGRLLVSFLIVFSACNVHDQKLDGVYEIISKHKNSSAVNKDSVRTIALFKSGYWITISFTQESLIKCSGGNYSMKSKYCIQTVDFNSADTSAIGKEYAHTYNSDEYLAASFATINLNNKNNGDNVGKKISRSDPLKNAFLEGVWKMKPGQGVYNKDEVIRIFIYPYFARTIYNLKEKRFYNTYGGIYEFDGKELIEKVEYSNYQILSGGSIEWSVKKLRDNEIQLFDVDSFNDEEIFDKINNH